MIVFIPKLNPEVVAIAAEPRADLATIAFYTQKSYVGHILKKANFAGTDPYFVFPAF